jgi:hypothetical protein
MDRLLTIKVESDARDAWRIMLDAVCRAGFPVAVVVKDPQQAEGPELERFEGVLLEVENDYLRVQPVDANDLPCAPTEYVSWLAVDHVQVYSRRSGQWLDAIGFAEAAQ